MGGMDEGGLPPLPDMGRVECYAGYRGEQEPRRFNWAGLAVEVVEIVDRWQGPDHRYFKLRGVEPPHARLGGGGSVSSAR